MRFRSVFRFGAIALLVVLQHQIAEAQTGTITGLIRSAETGSPLVSALVRVNSVSGDQVAGSLSNQSGRYQISNVAPGVYEIVVLYTGYESGRQASVNVVAGQTATANFDLGTRAFDLDPIVVSASRRQERALDAPSRTEVVNEQEISVRPAVSPVDHLRSIPGLDIATSGVQTTSVVARGFNNIFSGALYTLTDHRIAGVPSLRVNLMHLVPSTNDDLETIEVVLGPGSALYGPGTANGVLHMLTRSPLSSQGTTFSVTGGEQGLLLGTFRTAHLLSENLGVKLSGQLLRADEWQYVDPVEASERTKFAANPGFWRQDLMRATGISGDEADRRIARIAQRDFDVDRWSGEIRADWRVNPEFGAVFSAGTTTFNGIELTGLGAGQAVDWRYNYLQARANWGGAFGQVYLNSSDAGDTFLLRNGAPISDRSKLFVTQLQHAVRTFGDRQGFTYGADLLLTMPETEGTINGVYEEDDQITEIGAYLQSETSLSSKFDLILAGRVDSHSALPDPIFSPRAALVFKPTQDQTLRVSFNRAFSTPTSLTQFLDLGAPFPVAAAAQLGYSLRIQGTGDQGFRFAQQDGSYQIRSPFYPQAAGGPAELLPAAQARMFWPAAVQVLGAQVGLEPQLVQFLAGLQGASVQLNYVNPIPGAIPAPLSQLALDDIAAIRESTSNTVEIGHKGILGERLLIATDIWWTRRENLITPLTFSTPFVHFDAATARTYLEQELVRFFLDQGAPGPVAQARATATAAQLGPGIAQVPLGVISSEDVAANGAQALVTYFNVDDDLDLYGADIAFTALVTPEVTVEASASLVSDDVFETRRGTRVTLNAPKTKGTIAAVYRSTRLGLHGETRVRYNAAYPVDSGVYRATGCLGDTGDDIEPCVGDFTLIDLTLGYDLPQFAGASIQLTVQNLLDSSNRTFPGVPDIGRMGLLRLRYSF